MSEAASIKRKPLVNASRPDRLKQVPWLAVILFIIISFGLTWLVVLPLWLTEPDTTKFTVLAAVLPAGMMFTPLIATLVVVFVMKVPNNNRLRFLGMWPLRPAKRVVWFMAAATIAPLVLVIASLGVSAVFGWVHLDLVHFSGFKEMLGAPLDESLLLPVMLTQIAVIPFAAIFNSIPAFGEEIGWRGWLLPALRPLGLWPALILSGAIWGLWHAPMTLLGHNFNQPNLWGVLIMTVGCVAWGTLFAWARLRSGSVWPAVIGHGALNASAGLVLMVGAADKPMEMALVNPLGVSGWIIIAVIVLVLALTGQFKHEPQLG